MVVSRISAIASARTHRTMRATAVICRLYHTMYTSVCRSCSSDSEKYNFYTVKYKRERVLASESRFSACRPMRRWCDYQRRVQFDRCAIPPSDIVYTTQCTYIFVVHALLIQKKHNFYTTISKAYVSWLLQMTRWRIRAGDVAWRLTDQYNGAYTLIWHE